MCNVQGDQMFLAKSIRWVILWARPTQFLTNSNCLRILPVNRWLCFLRTFVNIRGTMIILYDDICEYSRTNDYTLWDFWEYSHAGQNIHDKQNNQNIYYAYKRKRTRPYKAPSFFHIYAIFSYCICKYKKISEESVHNSVRKKSSSVFIYCPPSIASAQTKHGTAFFSNQAWNPLFSSTKWSTFWTLTFPRRKSCSGQLTKWWMVYGWRTTWWRR